MDFGSAGGNRSFGSNKSFGTPSRNKGGAKTIRDERNLLRGRLLTAEEEGGYPSAIQLYLQPPTMDISLEMFEDLAVQRLKVLRVFEKQNLSGKQKFSSEWTDAILKDLRDSKPSTLAQFYELAERVETGSKKIPVATYQANRETDLVSHFILRLAYCRTEELRRWFVTHETDLFRLRWGLLRENAPEELQLFMTASGLSYQPIDSQEKERLKDDLMAAAGFGMSTIKFEEEKFYRVPWTEAVDLVRVRRVLIKGGMAYIPSSELLSLVVGVFRAKLSHNLVLTCRALPVLEEDSRLVNLVQNLDKRYTGEDYGANKTAGRVLPQEVDQLSKRNFPLCMKSMQEALNTTHHIKYKARLQYGLFLKGIGLTLEDAMKFFRGEFIKRADVDVDKFEKEYAYGIRYNYGKEGKKKNWQPYDCMRIIMETVGTGENHGCPFRHHEAKTIRQRIESYDLKKEEVDTILKKVEEGHYQIACGMHYSAVHLKDLTTGSVSHPNQWYLESRGLGGGGDSSAKSNKHIKTVHAAMYQSQDTQDTQDTQDSQSQLEMMDDSELIAALDTGNL
eukprot:GFUD01012477.1.p1 GENE.GFUD01012477.1~~GFUD01012477.1.p1  ORF type:complete len:562 (-),score=199.08 GFUD01012477.1:87-1772(-)